MSPRMPAAAQGRPRPRPVRDHPPVSRWQRPPRPPAHHPLLYAWRPARSAAALPQPLPQTTPRRLLRPASTGVRSQWRLGSLAHLLPERRCGNLRPPSAPQTARRLLLVFQRDSEIRPSAAAAVIRAPSTPSPAQPVLSLAASLPLPAMISFPTAAKAMPPW